MIPNTSMPIVMVKRRLLDLFCGAGGAARGYQRAGFYVVGVDINPQPRYAGDEFHRADAMTFPLDGFDVIHASPPCQAYSVTRFTHPHVKHPELIVPTRERLRASGLPYVIENVIGAPLEAPIILCGTMFGLRAIDTDGKELFLKRHRLFESNVWLNMPTHCTCGDQTVRCGGVYGGGPSNRNKTKNETRGRGGYAPSHAVRRALLDTTWMVGKEVNQAIPPAYCEWIGAQLMSACEFKNSISAAQEETVDE